MNGTFFGTYAQGPLEEFLLCSVSLIGNLGGIKKKVVGSGDVHICQTKSLAAAEVEHGTTAVPQSIRYLPKEKSPEEVLDLQTIGRTKTRAREP